MKTTRSALTSKRVVFRNTSRSPRRIPQYTTRETSTQEEKGVFLKMTEIEKIQSYIAQPTSGKFPLDTRYQMGFLEARALSCMNPMDAVCLAFDYGRAKGYRAAKKEALA